MAVALTFIAVVIVAGVALYAALGRVAQMLEDFEQQ